MELIAGLKLELNDSKCNIIDHLNCRWGDSDGEGGCSCDAVVMSVFAFVDDAESNIMGLRSMRSQRSDECKWHAIFTMWLDVTHANLKRKAIAVSQM